MITKTMIAGLLLAMAWSGPAQAQQSPVPFGHWSTTPPSEQLVVNNDGSCAFFFMGQVRSSGTCDWNASSIGGILTITYPMPLEPGHVRFNVLWVNKSTIKVEGEVYHLTQ